ncbi:hypothetical protein FGB62_124g025 [Gracilaria domingensis]|nr:hypothetical protein FGB62_124g025 [Gracilaria domingensis]
MAAIGIPVYLDVGLEARRGVELQTYPHAFVLDSKREDVASYENKFGISIEDLNEQSKKVYRRCTKVDADGWLVASLGNLTVQENGDQVECIPNTQRKVFRSIGNMEALQNYSNYEREIVMKFSWLSGPREALPNNLVSQFDRDPCKLVDNDDVFFLITNWTLVGSSGLECFPIDRYGIDCMIWPQFVCQNLAGSVSEYWISEQSGIKEVVRSEAVNELLTSKTGTQNATMYYMETLEFEDDGVISAAHFANPGVYTRWFCDVCGDHPFLFVRKSFYSALEIILYTRIDNATLRVPGTQFGRTVISDHVVILGVLEVVIVLLFGICMWLYLWTRRAKVQKPNTLNGLSEVWSVSNECSEYDGRRERRRITLGMRKSGHSEQKNILVPLREKSSNCNEEFSYSELSSTLDEAETETETGTEGGS